MSLKLNPNEARNADNISGAITETGKYVGVITRAEKLLSPKGTQGFGLSFKSDSGNSANYLDLYTVNAAGEKLRGLGFVQAILACTRTKEAKEGTITYEKWDKEAKAIIKSSATGYPELMGKRIGLLLQKELSTNSTNGQDVERLNVYAVFEADTQLTATEILDAKTKPEQLEKIVQQLAAHPVRNTRKDQSSSATSTKPAGSFDDFEEDIPF